MSATLTAGWIIAGTGTAASVTWYVRSGMSAERKARLFRVRRARGELAAVEASLDQPAFAPEHVRDAVREMLVLAGALWDGRDPPELSGRGDGTLIRAWARSRAKFLGSGLRLEGEPQFDVLRVVNREREDEDRMIVRVRVDVHRNPITSRTIEGDQTILGMRKARLDERWNLARDGGRWMLISAAGDPLGGPVLTAPLIPNAAADTERLHEQSLRELSDRESRDRPIELTDTALPPALRLLDLSLADDRFSPLLIAATIKHIVECWEHAGDGSERPLLEVADRYAADALLHPNGHERRRLILDATLERWELIGMYPGASPPRVRARVLIKAAVYEVSDTSVSGDDRRRRDLWLDWRLALVVAMDGQPHWRLSESDDEARR